MQQHDLVKTDIYLFAVQKDAVIKLLLFKVMNPQAVAQTMRDFEMANTKMNMTEEMMNDTLDDIMNEDGDEVRYCRIPIY